MRVSSCVMCKEFPCTDVRRECHVVPSIDLEPGDISIIMISEAAPADKKEYYYAKGDPSFQKTTVEVFNQAGVKVQSVNDIVRLGVYLTTAVKCGKTGYNIQSSTIEQCSRLLEKEIALFPNAKVLMLMGDVAIKSLNSIARRAGEKRPIPAGSTYRLRKGKYSFRGMRVFPSYLQVGPSFGIEKGKHKVVAEDIAAAIKLVH